MSDNVVLLLCDMLMPIVMILTGLFIWKFPSEYGGLGYSTPMSQKNALTWKTAQIISGKSFFFTFLALLPISIIAQAIPLILHLSENTGAVICMIVTAVQVLAIIIPVTITERTLSRCFDKDGNPRR